MRVHVGPNEEIQTKQDKFNLWDNVLGKFGSLSRGTWIRRDGGKCASQGLTIGLRYVVFTKKYAAAKTRNKPRPKRIPKR